MRPLHVLRMLQSGRALSWHKFTLSSHDQFQDNFSSMSTFRARWTLSCSCFYVIFSAGCSTCWLYSQSIKMPWWWHLAGTMQVQRLGCDVDGQDMSARLLTFSSCHFEIFWGHPLSKLRLGGSLELCCYARQLLYFPGDLGLNILGLLGRNWLNLRVGSFY